MLRREPTKITLNPDDIASYDTRKAQRDEVRQQQEYAAANQSRDQSAAMSGLTPRNARHRNTERDAPTRILGPRS